MESSSQEKKSRVIKKSDYSNLRIKRETRKRFLLEMSKINKKDFGKKVHADTLVNVLLGLLKPEHITSLQDASLSNADRLERDYRAYVVKHGPITKDAYLGLRLSGETKSENDAKGAGNG